MTELMTPSEKGIGFHVSWT